MFGARERPGLALLLDASNADLQAQVRDQLSTHGVVCLHFDRPLTDAEFRCIATLFGPIKDLVARARDGSKLRYGNERQVIDAGFVLTDAMRSERGTASAGGDDLRPGLFEFFHTDDSYVEHPAAATIVHARALPPSGGGDTCFIDMRVAFRLLDAATQNRLMRLRAVHAFNNRGAFPPRASASGPLEQLTDVSHPIVRAHPVTREPALYFDLDRATHIEGMPLDEGRGLLQWLQNHAEHNAPRYNHRWRPHDVLIWDNASVQHKASGDFPLGEPRRLWRHLLVGPKPIGFRNVAERALPPTR